jgi:peptide-methionine (S)-S-oxide reductase
MHKIVLRIALIGALGVGACPALAATETAIYAGGCFWCVEHDLDQVPGVLVTTSGYAGGTTPDPTYGSHDGYREAVRVEYDPAIVSYDRLTAYFLRTIDVFDGGGQFCDRGDDYVPTLFPLDADQRDAAAVALRDVRKQLGKAPSVEISRTPTFFPAEAEHQDFYLGTSLRLTWFGFERQSEAYEDYRMACGRDARVKKVWGARAFQLPG